MSDDIVQIGKFLEGIFSGIDIENSKKAVSVANEWKKIVSRLKPAQNSINQSSSFGSNIADHSRVVDLKNGILLVEADHPGWISLLQFYKNYILKGFKMALPELSIHNIVFKISGTRGELHETNEEREQRARKILEKQMEAEDKIDGEQQSEIYSKRRNRELPPELKSIFQNIERDMLTNDKK